MSKRLKTGFLFSLLSAAAVGCGDDNPPPPADSGVDADVPVQPDVPIDNPVDVPDDDGGPQPTCANFDFLQPTNNQVLGIADDADRNCSNGFAYNVRLATNAPNGTVLQLYVNSRMAATATVNGPSVVFGNVSLDVGATSTLEVRQGTVTMACRTVSVSVNCNLPRCQITLPDHSTLNQADNTGSPMAFATNFRVGTDIEEGRQVDLLINSSNPIRAAVMGGMANFTNVPLAPDGMFRVRASCTNAAGNTGTSAETVFTVDSTPPTLTLQSPAMNTVFGLSNDVNAMVDGVQFNVCGRSDATGQPLCAGLMGSMPACSNVTAPTTDTCVEVTCPSGGAPFDVTVNVRDAAGNTTRQTISGLRCQSSLPSVRVVAPAGYNAANPATILNAARDADAMTPGLQTDVVACTDRTAGMASLFINGATMAAATATVAPAAMGDPCATLGMGFVGTVRFRNVTLPESFPARTRPNAAPPTTPTLQVAVTDAGDTGRSAAGVYYIDSVVPLPSVIGARQSATASPNCAAIFAPSMADGSTTADVRVLSDAYPVTLTLARMGEMPTTLPLTDSTEPGGVGTFSNVRFRAGRTTLTLTTTDPAGNSATSATSCTVEVGNPPQVMFTSPRAGATFNTSTPVTVTLSTVDVPVGTTVTLRVGMGTPVTGTVAAGGTVTFNNVTLPEGDAVSLTATVTLTGGATATSTIAVVVDTRAPTSVTTLTGAVPTTPANARRAGTIRLSWRDGSDPNPAGGTRAVARYEIRRASTAVTAANFAMASLVATTARPGTPGGANTADVTGMQLEQAHYFGVRAYDAAGNASPDVTSVGPVTINLTRATISAMASGLGSEISGGFDTNSDGFADVLAATGVTSILGSGGIARLYLGSATGLSTTSYVEFRGDAAQRFGLTATSLGDVNGDGRGDIIIGEPGPNSAPFTAGTAYIFFGRASWRTAPSAYMTSEADVTITGGTGDFANALFGSTTARVGDFNGDSINDIAVGAQTATYSQGATSTPNRGAVCIFFGRATWPRTLSPNAASVIIRNGTTDNFLGRFLAGGGRVMGNDNLEDILIGMGSTSAPGAAAVVAGRAATGTTTVDVTTMPDATVFYRPGDPTYGNRQFLVAGIGDVNGDGRSDMAVSTGTGQGVVFLHFGNAAGRFDPEVRVFGTGLLANDVFGARLASITQPTQPRPSLLVPAPTAADLLAGANNVQAGDPRLFVFAGRSASVWATTTSSTADYTTSITGTSSQPMTAVNWVGDVDGDGYPDMAFGQPSGANSVTLVR